MEQQLQLSPKKGSGNGLKLALIVVAVLFAGAAGFAVWQTTQLSAKTSDLAAVTDDKAKLESDKLELQAEVETLKTDPGTTTPTSETSDTDAMLNVVDAYVRAPVEAQDGTYKYNVVKRSGSFARVAVAVDGGGGYAVWLKKVDTTWTVLVAGQDTPSPADMDKYGIPADL